MKRGQIMKKWLLMSIMFIFLSVSLDAHTKIEAADPSLIMLDDAYQMLMSPDFDGNVMSQAEADAIIEAIIEDLDTNFVHYDKSNRQAFYNAVESYIPGNMMGAVYKTMPDYFIAYVDALIEENGVASEPQATTDTGDFSVDVTLFDSIVDFHLLTPTYRHIQMDTINQQMNFQGSVLDDSANYDFYFQELPNQVIKVLSSDGSGVRDVTVSTNVVVEGLNANYHFGTDQAFLFHNSQGSISLAYPDLTGLLNDIGQSVWLEYRLVGNYGDGFKMIDQNEIVAGRPEFDLSREWPDQLARMDVEYTVAHVVSPLNQQISSYNFSMDPIFAEWYTMLFTNEPELHSALNVYDHTFTYELLKGGYSQEEAEIVNLVRIRAYDFIRQGEDEQRYAQKMRTTKVALADRLYNHQKLKDDPVLEEIFNQIAVYTGMTLQGHDLISIEQNGTLLEIGLGVSEPIASGYPVYIYDLTTGDIYIDSMGGDLELLSTNAIQSSYGIEVDEYTPRLQIPADYQLNLELVADLIRE